MHQLTISVPDEKYEAFLEFTKIQQLEITNDEVNGIFEIPEWHKEVVLKRIEESKNSPDNYIPHETFKSEMDKWISDKYAV